MGFMLVWIAVIGGFYALLLYIGIETASQLPQVRRGILWSLVAASISLLANIVGWLIKLRSPHYFDGPRWGAGAIWRGNVIEVGFTCIFVWMGMLQLFMAMSRIAYP
jgi:hypothetical protein